MKEIQFLSSGENYHNGGCYGGLRFTAKNKEGLVFGGGIVPNGHIGPAEFIIKARWYDELPALAYQAPSSRSHIIGLWKGSLGQLTRWVEEANDRLTGAIYNNRLIAPEPF